MTKTLSFSALHFTVAFTVAYVLTGSFVIGGAIALIEPTINTIAYHFHEKVWDRYRNRRDSGTSTQHRRGQSDFRDLAANYALSKG